MSIPCPQCKFNNDDEGQFCSRCGAKLETGMDSTITFTLSPEGAEEAQVDFERLAEEGPLLIVTKGVGVGRIFPLEGENVRIGRDPDSDIFLDDVTVSRSHAVIDRSGGKLAISDTGSLNGTYVNRERVEQKELGDHDEVQIGKFKMIFIEPRGALNER